jgi:1-deoxy-D-xylulose-5-phosphate reductoisomerase
MVVCRDGSVMAQMGTPDMRVPIAYGLAYPQRIATGAATLDFSRASSMGFEPLDAARFPGLALAYRVLSGPAGGSVILNAANEVAVEAFLGGRLSFPGIHAVNLGVLDALEGRHEAPCSLDDLLELDARARHEASQWVAREGAR